MTNNVNYHHTHPQRNYHNQMPINYNQMPFQQFQQMPHPVQQQYHQFQQQPQYQQQYRQQQYGYQQPQQQMGYGFQQPLPNMVNNVHTRKTRQAGNKKKTQTVHSQTQTVAETNVAGEAELYFYNKLKDHMTDKVGNFSCIMHELGYFTEDNQVDHAQYKAAYQKLTLPEAMKQELIENIDICHEVSECLPERCFAKYPYGREYGRSFFFVMCEKKKATEVCLKKQMVDDYYKYKDVIGNDDISMDDPLDMFSMGF